MVILLLPCVVEILPLAFADDIDFRVGQSGAIDLGLGGS